MLKAPVFDASAKILIGKNVDTGLIEESVVVTTTLLSRYGKEVAVGKERDLPVLKKASLLKVSDKVLELTVEGRTPEESTTLLKQITNELILRHQAIQQSILSTLNERILNLKSQRDLLQKELYTASEIIKNLKHRDSVQAAFILLESRQISTSLNKIDEELFLLYQKISSPETTPTKIIGEIYDPLAPATPKKVLVISISSAFGLMIGLLIAFLAEFISNVKLG